MSRLRLVLIFSPASIENDHEIPPSKVDRYQVTSNEILIVWNHGGDNKKQLESAIKFSIIIGIFSGKINQAVQMHMIVGFGMCWCGGTSVVIYQLLLV